MLKSRGDLHKIERLGRSKESLSQVLPLTHFEVLHELGATPIYDTLEARPAFVAQRIEHLTTDQKVGGSSPSKRTMW